MTLNELEEIKNRAEDEYRKRLYIVAHGKTYGKYEKYGLFYTLNENKLYTMAFVLDYSFSKVLEDIEKAVKEIEKND